MGRLFEAHREAEAARDVDAILETLRGRMPSRNEATRMCDSAPAYASSLKPCAVASYPKLGLHRDVGPKRG